MKKLLILSIGLTMALSAIGQQLNGNWCGTDKLIENQLNNNPDFAQDFHEQMVKVARANNEKSSVLKTIPVVFHIIHDNGVGNISNEQVQSALDILNINWNRLNADTADTRDIPTAPFKQYAGSMEVDFRLAKIDPNGQCTNGIERRNSPGATYEVDESTEPHKYYNLGGLDIWDRNKYLNIWVVNSIGDQSGGTYVAGYATLPYFGGTASNYGLTIMQTKTGTIETAAGDDGFVITHEVGHCFGLLHTFQAPIFPPGGSGCHSNDCFNAGDYCCDTPPSSQEFFPCDLNQNSCSDIPVNDPYGIDVLDQIENFMSYNSCVNMLSLDQINLVENVFVDYSWATNLISPANISYTQVYAADVLCEADFAANKTTVCLGDSISFTDFTYNIATGWNWTFEGGTPATSTDQNPTITYNTPGIFQVSLDATDGSNNDTETKVGYIHVLGNSAAIPFLEDFESYSTLSGIEEWDVYNQDGNNEFELETTTGHTGTKCARLNNGGQAEGSLDELISAIPLDLSNVSSNLSMSFRYAYVRRNSSDDDYLRVYITNDCGSSWGVRKTLHGFQLSSTIQSSPFTPSSQADWTTVHIVNIMAADWVDNFRYKFQFTAGGGNNFYVDNINIYEGNPSDQLVVGLQENEIMNGLSLYPNPVDGELSVSFNLSAANEAVLSIQDVSGKVVQRSAIKANEGSNMVFMNTDQMASGLYFLNMQVGGASETIQFLVK